MIPTYPLLIQEDVAQLQVAEKAARDKARADRLRLLRFLKEGRVASVSQAAEVLGYSVRTAQRWWQSYREGGLAALLAPPSQRGLKERITPEAWDGLQAEMRAGHIGGRRSSTCATPGASSTASTPFPSCSADARPS
jgi:DNA-binding transcriptional ArsR family regulator